ncbi:MAG: helix-turn-helix domain-containing protein [Candidatus Binatia bacterium]
MESVDLDTGRLRAVLAMFRISQGELARSANISPAMLSLTLAGKKRPSVRLAVAMIHGLEKLLTQDRRLDTRYFVTACDSTCGC